LYLVLSSLFFETWSLHCKRRHLHESLKSCMNSVREGAWTGRFMRNTEYVSGCLPYYSSSRCGQWDRRNQVRISFPMPTRRHLLQRLKMISSSSRFTLDRKQQKSAIRTKHRGVMVRPGLRTTAALKPWDNVRWAAYPDHSTERLRLFLVRS
jgi:hypothetical protein